MPRTDIMTLLGKTIGGIGYGEKGNILIYDEKGEPILTLNEGKAFDGDGNLFDTEWIE